MKTKKMTRERVAEIIAAARDKGERPNLRDANLGYLNLSGMNLYAADMTGANLTGANIPYSNLHGANLQGADLRYTNLHDANLHGANLRVADLSYTTLRGANLDCADLTGANLTGAYLPGLALQGLPSGVLVFTPTPGGWFITIGCWDGTLAELRELIAGDDDWPEARGKEIAARRPMLEAAADLCEAYAAAHPEALAEAKDAADQWKDNR